MNTLVKIISVVLLVLVFLFFSLSLAKQIIRPQNVRVAEEQKKILATSVEDTDQDGLLDWEERLWGTDINNTDTDQDGVSDGEEVRVARNPNGDENAESFEQLRQTNEEIKDSLQPTNKGTSATTTSKTAPATTTAISIPENPLQTYGNVLAKIIIEKGPETAKETSAFNAVISSRTPESFDQLSLIGKNYENLALAIQKTVPPKDLSEIIENITTNYTAQTESIKNIVSFKDQGKAPAEAYQAHNKNVIATAESLTNLMLFFRNHGVVFKDGEVGNIFNLPF